MFLSILLKGGSNYGFWTHYWLYFNVYIEALIFFSSTVKPLYEGEITDLKILVQLGAFNMLLCDQHCNIADMKIRGQIYIIFTSYANSVPQFF